MSSVCSGELGPTPRWHLAVQREVARLFAPIAFPLVLLALRFGLGYRIEGRAAVRREYRRIRSRRDAPLLVCANHLTMIDSFLIAWALASPFWYLCHFWALPWNVPEQRKFAAKAWMRPLAFAVKCIPIQRGGKRSEIAAVLARLAYLLRKGETVLIFPEAGRSRTGRVDLASAAPGVGRVIRAVPNCRVLCVYLRGDRQGSHSTIPARGDRFRVSLREFEPKTDESGLRGSRDLARQLLRQLSEMEREHFDGRQ